MSAEQAENKGRPEELVIPSNWQIEPVQPPPGSKFKQASLITEEQVRSVLQLSPRQRKIGVIFVPSNADLNLHSTLPRNITCITSPSLVIEKEEWRIGLPAPIAAVIEARESQIVWTRADKPYLCLGMSENQRIIENNLSPNSFVARLLIATVDKGGINFLCKLRGEETSSYRDALEIPGGLLELTEEAKQYMANPPLVSSSGSLTESFSEANEREYFEEFGLLMPVIQARIGAFVTFVTKSPEKTSFLEVTELAVVSPSELEAVKRLGNLRLASTGSINEWQIEGVKTVLKSKQPMLPTLHAVLSRFEGQYIYEYMGWQIYGEYVPYNQTYFETRGKEIEI